MQLSPIRHRNSGTKGARRQLEKKKTGTLGTNSHTWLFFYRYFSNTFPFTPWMLCRALGLLRRTAVNTESEVGRILSSAFLEVNAKAIHTHIQRAPRGERYRTCANQLSPPGFPWTTIAVQGPRERQQRIIIAFSVSCGCAVDPGVSYMGLHTT